MLLTTALGPYEPYYYDTSLTDVWNQRFSRGCDIFTVNGHIHTHFAHALAQNIDADTVFLEYPTRKNFLAELERDYDYVGISGFQHQVDAIVRMTKLVRERSPKSVIIIGGWAAMGLGAIYPRHEWKAWADHLCAEEGIAFMRRLLGQEPRAPISITHLPKGSFTFSWLDRHLPGNIGAIVASMGCTRGCDFCGPSSIYDRRRIELLSPRQVVSELDRLWHAHPGLSSCAVYEEDSFLKKDYLMEVGRLIREETEFGLSRINLMILGGIRSLEPWEFDEILRCGVSQVFIGVESKLAPENYDKARGRTARQVFHELHRRGIATIGGWMAGFDFQTRENIEEDLAHFVSLEPTLQQLARVCAFPGTPLWERVKAEGRVDPEQLDWRTFSFFGGGGLKPKNLEAHEVMEIVDRGYRKLYETWGSCFARLFNVNMNGWEYCSQHSDPCLRYDRARLHRRLSGRAYPFMKAHEVFAPNGTVRHRMRGLRQRYEHLFGRPTLAQRALERLYLSLARRAKEGRLFKLPGNMVKTEPFKRYDYTVARRPGECPYVATHPNLNLRYGLYRRARDAAYGGMVLTNRLLNRAERALVRELEPELTECLPEMH